MAFVHKEIVIAELYSLFPRMPIFRANRRKWEEKNAQYLECIRAVEKIPTVDKDYNKLLEQIVEQEQAICRQAERDIGQGKIRSEGIAQGLYVAARMIKRFYEEDISEANTRG